MTAVLDRPALFAAGTWPLRRGTVGVVLLAALLVAAPIPLGGAADPARAWLVVAAAAVALVGIVVTSGRERAAWLPASTGLWLGVLVIPAWQLLPFGGAPSPTLGGATPTHGSWVPAHTLARFAELAAAVVLFVATARLCDRAVTCRRVIVVLLGAGVLLVGYGLLASVGVLPLLDDAQTRTVLVATFVNRNHTANLLVMVALLGAGFVVAAIAESRRGSAALAALAVGVAAIGVVATASRGALLALLAGAFALPTFLAPSAWTWRRAAGAAAVACIAALWLLPADVAARFARVGGELRGHGSRPDIWQGALALWQTAPWCGTGLGTFGDLSPATQSAAVPGRIEHAHCDLLEFLVETGIVGAAAVSLAVGAFFFATGRRCRRVRDRERARIAAGALAALAAFTVHSLVEFPLQMPANLLWAAGLAGLAAGLLRPRQPTAAPALTNGLVVALACTALGIGGSRLLSPGAGDGLAAIARSEAVLAHDPAAAATAAGEALAQNGFSPRAHRLLAMARLAVGDHDGARDAFAQALAWTNPADRPQHQLAVAVDCLRAGAAELAVDNLHELLPRLSPQLQREALATLYAALPAVEALLPLLAAEAPSVRRAFAEVLLQRGDFAGREAVLASLGERAALATLADGLLLVDARAEPTAAGNGITVQVELDFDGPAVSNGGAMVLRCDGVAAAVHRPFRVDAATFRHAVRLDATFPPGRYELALDFRRDAPAYPLAAVVVSSSPLLLAPGVVHGATQLYWATGVPDRRSRPANGLPLRAGDVAWRQVTLAEHAHDLIVETAAPTRLRMTFADIVLSGDGDGPSRVHRAALPAIRVGDLRLCAVDGDEPVLRRLSVTTRGS